MSTASQYKSVEVRPHKRSGYVMGLKGDVLKIPLGWELLPPGDPALSRRIKKAHDTWVIKVQKGRRLQSKGILSDKVVINRLREELKRERADPKYQKKLDAGRARRAQQEVEYKAEFICAVRQFLQFSERYVIYEKVMAQLITEHAIPVGSKTVARTQMITLEKRAEAATIAWMRHQTTAYDSMKIARVKGARREVRRELAAESRKLLSHYRSEAPYEALGNCPLYQVLDEKSSL